MTNNNQVLTNPSILLFFSLSLSLSLYRPKKKKATNKKEKEMYLERSANKIKNIANTLKTNRIDTCLFAQTHTMLANKSSYRSDSKTTSLTLGLLALLALVDLKKQSTNFWIQNMNMMLKPSMTMVKMFYIWLPLVVMSKWLKHSSQE